MYEVDQVKVPKTIGLIQREEGKKKVGKEMEHRDGCGINEYRTVIFPGLSSK